MKQYLHIQNHQGMNVYYLNKEGRELIGSEREMKWNLQAEHHIMRNDIYIHYGLPESWEVEARVVFEKRVNEDGVLRKKEYYITPDARFVLNGVYHFLEVDRTQNMLENQKKIQLYAELSPLMLIELNQQPVIIFYTLSEYRQKKLKQLCAEKKLVCEVYTKEDLK